MIGIKKERPALQRRPLKKKNPLTTVYHIAARWSKPLVLAGAVLACASVALADNAVTHRETYVVRAGDTLDAIAMSYMGREGYAGPQDVREFREEIIQGNPAMRERRALIHPGDRLVIVFPERRGPR